MEKFRSWILFWKSQFVIEHISTFDSEDSAQNYIEALNSTSAQAAQVFRANHGGGMPCPDNVCSKPSFFLDNV